LEAAARRTVGVRDIPLVLFCPRRLFARVEDVGAWGWPLAVLLTPVTLIGYATIQTGLIDRETDRQVRERIARIDQTQRDVVELSALRELYEHQVKQGQFEKMLRRIQVVVAAPIAALAASLLTAGVFYGIVALTGRKPEWHTLLTICIYGGFIDALRLAAELALMLRYETLEVYTSLAPLTRRVMDVGAADAATLFAVAGGLMLIDPFRIWYWLTIATGLRVTSQLGGWRVWSVCAACWLLGAAVRMAAVVAPSLQDANQGG
jgi:hypothetical protein